MVAFALFVDYSNNLAEIDAFVDNIVELTFFVYFWTVSKWESLKFVGIDKLAFVLEIVVVELNLPDFQIEFVENDSVDFLVIFDFVHLFVAEKIVFFEMIASFEAVESDKMAVSEMIASFVLAVVEFDSLTVFVTVVVAFLASFEMFEAAALPSVVDIEKVASFEDVILVADAVLAVKIALAGFEKDSFVPDKTVVVEIVVSFEG